MDKQTLYDKINSLLEKYSENEYISGRIYNYIEKLLPAMIENEVKTQAKREERKKQLSDVRDEFIERFMHKNNYFYSPHCELFLIYDGLHFHGYSEDNIQHQILTTITSEQSLIPWKHKITKSIVKIVKERSPLKHLPESATIQYVINSIFPSIFSSRNHAKYFLTVIGDCLTNKASQNEIYIASHNLKELIREIGNQSFNFFVFPNVFHTIKYKYYDHNFSDCRLIDTQPTINQKIWETGFQKQIVDLLCVAAHYSKRYGSADGFAERYKEQTTVQLIRYLTDKTNESLVEEFIDQNIQKHTQEGGSITYPEMVYLWKQHLVRKRIPNVIFNAPLRATFLKLLTHDSETDSFTDVTSAQLPSGKMFMEFWESQMMSNEQETHLEIDEIMTLMKQWNKKALHQMDAACILRTLKHFYPDVEVEDDKFIMHVESKLWSKKKHIDDFLTAFRAKCMDETDENGNVGAISLHNAYDAYNDFSKGALIMASKPYFERHLFDTIEEYIDENNCISSAWSS